MTAKAQSLGHAIEFDERSERWRYVSNGSLYTPDMAGSGQRGICVHCRKPPTDEGHDGCLGTLPPSIVMNACCGHGNDRQAYIQYWDGSAIRGSEAITEQRRLKGDSPMATIDPTTHALPCPFCGGPPAIYSRLDEPVDPNYAMGGHMDHEFVVSCHECGAEGQKVTHYNQHDMPVPWPESPADIARRAVELWNRRDDRHADLYEPEHAAIEQFVEPYIDIDNREPLPPM